MDEQPQMTPEQAWGLIDGIVANVRNPPMNRIETFNAHNAMVVLAKVINATLEQQVDKDAGED